MTCFRLKSKSDSKIHAVSTIPKWTVAENPIFCLLDVHNIFPMLGTNLQRIKIHEAQSLLPWSLERPCRAFQRGCSTTLSRIIFGKECEDHPGCLYFLFSGFWMNSLWLDVQHRETIWFTSWPETVNRRARISHGYGMAWGSFIHSIVVYLNHPLNSLCFRFGHVITVSRTPRWGLHCTCPTSSVRCCSFLPPPEGISSRKSQPSPGHTSYHAVQYGSHGPHMWLLSTLTELVWHVKMIIFGYIQLKKMYCLNWFHVFLFTQMWLLENLGLLMWLAFTAQHCSI